MLLPLLGSIESENIGPGFKGELIKCLCLYLYSELVVLEEESENISLLEVGLRLRNSSSTLGSMMSSGRSSHPLAVLKFASASVALSLRPIYRFE